MKLKKQELEKIIDATTRNIRNEQIDESIIDQSAERVWTQVSNYLADEDYASSESTSITTENSLSTTTNLGESNRMNVKKIAEQIDGCADFQSLIPVYLEGKLSKAQTMLLEDHTNGCIPCHRALKTQRTEGAMVKTTASNVRQPTPRPVTEKKPAYTFAWSKSNIARWSVAALLLICLGFGGLFLYENVDLSGRTLAATLQNADGEVYIFSDTHEESRKLVPGEQLQKGERIRTAKNSNAVLRLADGSMVEMHERSEFSVTENIHSVTVHLERGNVIVEAAKQDKGRLYVQTPDSLVSVKGTIFAVESGIKGSRVSVVEGEVKVKSAGKDETLFPGEQTTTNRSLEKVPVEKTVAWSHNATHYVNLISELAKLKRDVAQRVSRPDVRYSSRFLKMMPENTVFYAALPNFSESLAESKRIVQEHINQNQALAEWWKHKNGKEGNLNEQTLARVHEFSSKLGEEIVVGAEIDAKGEPSGVLVLSEVKNADDFRTYFDGEIASFNSESSNKMSVRIIDNPLTTNVDLSKKDRIKHELFVWIHKDIFAASPQIESLVKLANIFNVPDTHRFADSPFYQRINDVYKDGAGIIIAANLKKIIAQEDKSNNESETERRHEGFQQLDVTNLRDFVVEQKEVSNRVLSKAVLTFNEPSPGIGSWIASPASMGTLDFISPNANIVAAFVVENPKMLVDDLFVMLETVDSDIESQMDSIQKQQGLDISRDFAASLGGEFAFAVDGPIFPTPSWKIVLEVYDETKLQAAFERVTEKLNQYSALHNKGNLILESSTASGNMFYSIKSEKTGLEIHYTYSNGYLIAAPSRALLHQSIRNHDAENTLVRSPRFMSVLPQDGNANFSALIYHDLAPLIKPLTERMKTQDGTDLTQQQRQKIDSIDINEPPTLVYVYAQKDRLTLATNAKGGAFGLNPAGLIGLPSSFEMQSILMKALGDKNLEEK